MRTFIPISTLSAVLMLPAAAQAGDLGPYYEREGVVIDAPPPRLVERERIIERYYVPSPAPRAFYAPPRVYYGEPYDGPRYRDGYVRADYWRWRHRPDDRW